VRTIDESRSTEPETVASPAPPNGSPKTILVIDDSAMLLSFVKEILEEQNYDILTAPTATEGLQLSRSAVPDLILLDFVLPDMKGDEVCRQLVADPATAKIPVVYVSGFGSDLQPDRSEIPNVIGSISKPFTSETLVNAVRTYLGDEGSPPREIKSARTENSRPPPAAQSPRPAPNPPEVHIFQAETPLTERAAEFAVGSPYFCGESSFFSLYLALQTIAREKLTGTLRAFLARDSVELVARDGEVVVVTTRNPSLYCQETPATLLNVDNERIEAARARQAVDGCPVFITLAREGLILDEPGFQLAQHYGQRLFSQLWRDQVRFTFERQELPDFTRDLLSTEDSMDQWALGTLRFVEGHELGTNAMVETSSVPAYTRDGSQRVQELRLTVAEAQFASQFNGSRSIAQIADNLHLDINSARLTLFRFLALEIAECWPALPLPEPE